jgi:hypothetical protein
MSEGLPAASAFLHNNKFLTRLKHVWDGANQWWQQHVIEFNTRAQIDLLKKLGIDSPDWKHLGWAFAGLLTMWIAWISLTLRRGVGRAKPDRIGRAWLRATRKLAGVAPERAPDEGPMDFARRVAQQRPELAERVNALAALYTKLRFGPAPSHDEVITLEREVKRLAVSQR